MERQNQGQMKRRRFLFGSALTGGGQFNDFKPFWEFVAEPLNSGTFGPNKLDNTFDPQVKFNSVPPDLAQNRPPCAGLQLFWHGQN